MSAEQKKLLWISLSACAFVLALAVTGFFLFAPQKGGVTAPATIGNTAAPKSADPQDFLMTPPPVPNVEQPRTAAGDVVVVYGEKPETIDANESNPQATSLSIPSSAVPAASASGVPNNNAIPSGSVPTPSARTAKTPPATAAKKPVAAKPLTSKTAKKIKADEYWIQAASFSSRTRADELKETLAAKGIASIISVKDIDGKSWYRVRIGPYSIKAEAEGWLSRLKDLPGCSEAYVSKTTIEHNG